MGDRRGEFELTPAEFDAHCRAARVVERSQGRPIVLGHSDSSGVRLVTRVWYPKGRWSLSRLWPDSERFRSAARLLRARGIPAPVERAHGRVAGTRTRLVVVEQFDGIPLRLAQSHIDLKALAGFLAELHERGVYCRGLNLGSMLALRDGGYALVDVAGVELFGRPLPTRLRERSLGIFCATQADFDYWAAGRWSEIVMDYCRAANLTLTQSAAMRDRVRVQLERCRVHRLADADQPLGLQGAGRVER